MLCKLAPTPPAVVSLGEVDGAEGPEDGDEDGCVGKRFSPSEDGAKGGEGLSAETGEEDVRNGDDGGKRVLVGEGGPPPSGVRAGRDGREGKEGPGAPVADNGERKEGDPLWNEGDPAVSGPERKGLTIDGLRVARGPEEGRSYTKTFHSAHAL